MTKRVRRFCLAVAVLLPWLAPGLSAQTPAPSPATPAAPASTDEGIREIAPAPGGYTYNPMGRRDPFMSLIKPVGPQGEKKRKAGIEGFLIGEVVLRGIIKNNDGWIAFFSGTDGKSYWVRQGQRFFDGQLTAIDATTVSFRQEVSDPLSPVKTRDVKKYLYPSEEATQ